MEWRLLSGIPEEDVRRFLASARRRRFARNEVLFHDGDPADSLHMIARGRVAVRVVTPLGDTATLEIIGPGDVVGEIALLDENGGRSATVVALETTETLQIHRADFDALRTKHPSTSIVISRILAARLRRQTGMMVDALYLPADKRILRGLLRLCEIYSNGEVAVEIPLKQEDLAGIAGTTRSTVNRVLRAEEDNGALELRRGRVKITDLESIEKRAR